MLDQGTSYCSMQMLLLVHPAEANVAGTLSDRGAVVVSCERGALLAAFSVQVAEGEVLLRVDVAQIGSELEVGDSLNSLGSSPSANSTL